MAEKIVSPGVFTEEKDLSFLPQGIAGIGAAFVGPTIKGPAMIPTSVTSYGEFVQIFGDTNPNLYLPYAAKEYLSNSGQLTIVRTLHDDGYTLDKPLAILATGSFGTKHIALLHPSQVISQNEDFYDATTPLFSKSFLTSNASGSFVVSISGSYTVDTAAFPNALSNGSALYSASLNSSNANFLTKVFGKTANTTSAPAYLYTMFAKAASASLAADPNCTVYLQSGSSAAFDYSDGYMEAQTPWLISQTVNGANQNLFKLHTIADGIHSNYETKVAISNIKPAGTVAGSEYGSFTVTIRAVDQTKLNALGSPYSTQDSDLRPNVLESFDNVNLDPNSSRYIARVIGDRYKSFVSGKVVIYGDYPNKSKYVYVEVDDNVEKAVYSPELVPFGFASLYSPLPSVFSNVPAATFVTAQTINNIYNKRKHFGFDYDLATTDNINYLKPLPKTGATVGLNTKFLLSNCNEDSSLGSNAIDLTTATSIDSRKFIVPFQGGADGIQPNRRILVGSDIVAANTQGYDLSSNTANDYSVYTNAIDAVSNPDELDINMLVLPGVIQAAHSAVIDYAANMCVDRGDAFLVFDCVGLTANIAAATSAVEALDNNYAATYYPWVKIVDANINKPVWVPPSVVIPGVLAFNDKVAAEWYAPAGLNRGGLSTVLDAYTRLTHAERDTLYEGRVNPIATFPGQGVVVWGQKTLQAKPSALDRINVRRLLIAVKKYIASATKYLVFENNTAATRNRFLNICNPYLESVQQRQGLYSFKVVMDETNNTPDIIDRNVMYGQIFLQPAKTAEFIIIDFNILPTGAAFAQ
jgi:hypothetical protein